MTKKRKLALICEKALKSTSNEVIEAYLKLANNRRIKASDYEIDGYINEVKLLIQSK